MSVVLRLALPLLLGWAAAVEGVAADTGPGLYQGRTLVTGRTAEGRAPAIVRCFTEVLVKVSGDARLLGDPRVGAVAGQAPALVKDFRYRDLMAGLPVNDEQGTRDRPYELTVDFDPAGVDAALQALGRRPWTTARPRLVVLLRVQQGALSYLLDSDGVRSAGMREALADAAERAGLPVLLPSKAVLARSGLSAAAPWPPAARPALEAATRAAGGDVSLAGRLVWSEEALGWIADWQLAAEGKTHRWQVRGVSFDDAFRSATRGAAQILSGHGGPGR
jgi:hypothetical protein